MPEALIRGGTGQIGLAAAKALKAAGWSVRLARRSPPCPDLPFRQVQLDPEAADALPKAFGDGVDLLLDCVAFDAVDADLLLSVEAAVGHIVAISSASVYRDDKGRTLDEAGETGFPEFPVPVPETHPTVAPGPATYSTRKVAMERRLLDRARGPVTILRPCAIHGPHSKHAREWWFVKRLLDGRRRIPLADAGRSRFQTSSTRAIAAAVLAAQAGQTSDIVNVVDGDTPTVLEIGETIMACMGRHADLVPLGAAPDPPHLGRTPWSAPNPLVYASSLPPAPRYAETVPGAVDWLVGNVDPRHWQAALPQLAAYPRDHFDYAAEDAALARAG